MANTRSSLDRKVDSLLEAAMDADEASRRSDSRDGWFERLPAEGQTQLLEATDCHIDSGIPTAVAIFRLAKERWRLPFGKDTFYNWVRRRREGRNVKKEN